MFKFSIRQLFRQKGKAFLFFLLMAASTALVVTGSVMTIESTQRIDTVESTYTTIGMVEQLPVNVEMMSSTSECRGTQAWQSYDYGGNLTMNIFDFPGAEYVVQPENRPYFIFYQPDWSIKNGLISRHLVEFTPMESSTDGGPAEIEIPRGIPSDISGYSSRGFGSPPNLEVGDHLTFCQCWNRNYIFPLEAGEKYVANIESDKCDTHNQEEYIVYLGINSTQHDMDGNWIDHGTFVCDIPEYDEMNRSSHRTCPVRIDHVTGGDFYEPGHKGAIYEEWAEIHKMELHMFQAVGATSLETIPSWHNGSVQLAEGRAITQEEFDGGALVCMLPAETMFHNQLKIGDKIKLPFMAARYRIENSLAYENSYVNADGQLYEVFWDEEYEIVGTYTDGYQLNDLPDDTFIIPVKSVGASWADNICDYGPLNPSAAGFQLPNGSITRFDEALKANVPEAERLSVTYDDRGYTEIMKSLKNSRDMAHLLLLGGVLAALAIVALLLYFFVVKEKKRTAIERSLGMSKRQCRVSLLGGLAVLTAVSVLVGAVCGMAALQKVQEQPSSAGQAQEVPAADELDAQYKFSTEYSLWAEGRELAEEAVIEAHAPAAVYIAVPVLLCLLVELMAWLLLEQSFRTDPIYLLSTRENK